MAICEQTLCFACQSAETPLITIPLADLASARPSPLRESRTVRQWVSGLLGTSQPPQVACLAALPLSPASPSTAPASPESLLAVLYTNGLLSVWEAGSGRHLCQTIVGSGADGGHADPTTPTDTVTGMCASLRICALHCGPQAVADGASTHRSPSTAGAAHVLHVADGVGTLLCPHPCGCLAVYGPVLAFARLEGTTAFGIMQSILDISSLASCGMLCRLPRTSCPSNSLLIVYMNGPLDTKATARIHRARVDNGTALPTAMAR